MQSLINASKNGNLSGEIVLVISNNDKAYGLTRAQKAGIDTFVYKIKNYESKAEAHADLMAVLAQYKAEYIALAGYLKLTNIHPALLPKFGGKGMYGHHVHEAVLAAGEKESGPSIHLVDAIYDHGKVLEQKRVQVLPGDTPDTLAARVLEAEHEIYPIALNNLIRGKYD